MKLFDGLSLIADKKIDGIKRYRNAGTRDEKEIKIYFNKSFNRIVKEVDGVLSDGGEFLRITRLDTEKKWEEYNAFSNEKFDIIVVAYNKNNKVSTVHQDKKIKISLQELYRDQLIDPNTIQFAIGINNYGGVANRSKIIFDAAHQPTKWEHAPEEPFETSRRWVTSITEE